MSPMENVEFYTQMMKILADSVKKRYDLGQCTKAEMVYKLMESADEVHKALMEALVNELEHTLKFNVR